MAPESINSSIEDVFIPCGLKVSELVVDKESTTYHACSFQLNELQVIYRHAKVTPKKVGQFVTLWKRIPGEPIRPFDSSDPFDIVVISTKDGPNSGQFVFPKKVLSRNGILTHLKKEGKRGFRVYPPWDVTTSKQAQKTQKWQLEFFLNIPWQQTNLDRAKSLYSEPI